MMKKIRYLFVITYLIVINSLYAQNVDLLGQLDPYPNTAYADIWGYSSNDHEYALMGVTGGTSIIDVTDPANPVEVSMIAGPTAPPYEWRDIKVHSHYAYIVTEGGGSGAGLQIVDISGLPDSANLVTTVTTWFTSAHNIFIDNGFAYVIGTSGGGGMHILDLSDPVNPVRTAYYTASGYIHDVCVWNDTVVACAADSYDLVDVTDKNNPQLISVSISFPGIYAHSGWMTEDKRYLIAAEEFDVRDIIVWDLIDRTTWNPVVPEWQLPGDSHVHNIFVQNNFAHVSYYKEGYVVLDISDPENPLVAGQYDTYPGTSGTYDGAWGCYPYLPSGNVLISDMSTGLYVLDFLGDNTTTGSDTPEQPVNFQLSQNYPNPFNPSTRIDFSLPEAGMVNMKVFNIIGEEVGELINEFREAGNYEVEFSPSDLPSGLYILRLSSGNNARTIKMSLLK